MKIRFCFIALISLVAILLCSCDSNTKIQKGVISGVIILDGQTDYSGITVMLYSTDIVPEKLKEINN